MNRTREREAKLRRAAIGASFKAAWNYAMNAWAGEPCHHVAAFYAARYWALEPI